MQSAKNDILKTHRKFSFLFFYGCGIFHYPHVLLTVIWFKKWSHCVKINTNGQEDDSQFSQNFHFQFPENTQETRMERKYSHWTSSIVNMIRGVKIFISRVNGLQLLHNIRNNAVFLDMEQWY